MIKLYAFDQKVVKTKSKNEGTVVNMFFLRNRLYKEHTVVTSFRMHFEKIGRGLLREGKKRESVGLCGRSEGG